MLSPFTDEEAEGGVPSSVFIYPGPGTGTGSELSEVWLPAHLGRSIFWLSVQSVLKPNTVCSPSLCCNACGVQCTVPFSKCSLIEFLEGH